jgi:cellulose synthase/poly-beta-1,6-N-acetylglucosamine synthase-like glycosyltransferase
MHFFILSIFWLLFFFSFAYMLVLLMITIGWYRTSKFSGLTPGKLPDVTIIMAVRNEQKNIETTLSGLINQDYPLDQLEIVIVNDHSDDDTATLVQTFIKQNKAIHIRLIDSPGIGKKEAIREGIKKATSDLILTSDGDCSFEGSWVRHMVEFHLLKGAKMVVGPVIYFEKKEVFQKFYMLDFLSLVASGAGSLGMGLPLMANGANMLFQKQTYEDVLSVQSGKSHVSGDDVFLMHAIAKRHGAGSIHFIKDPKTIVSTEPPESFRSFMLQRKRWASKATAYNTWWPILVSLVVFGTNLMLVLSFIISVSKPWFLIIFGLFVLFKILTDLPLLHGFTEFSNRKSTVPYLFIFGFLYPFYVVFTALSSFFFRFSWKGRDDVK